MRPLTQEEVFEMLRRNVGNEDLAILAKSHEALRNQGDRVNDLVEQAIDALHKAKRPTMRG